MKLRPIMTAYTYDEVVKIAKDVGVQLRATPRRCVHGYQWRPPRGYFGCKCTRNDLCFFEDLPEISDIHAPGDRHQKHPKHDVFIDNWLVYVKTEDLEVVEHHLEEKRERDRRAAQQAQQERALKELYLRRLREDRSTPRLDDAS
ncbi:MAG: hypothetical protein CYG59_04925 [Chloroflexi bacterium]|nr:MAG: hypothetical protein CYG59_04925 [Chloroflexota bacterium]